MIAPAFIYRIMKLWGWGDSGKAVLEMQRAACHR